MATAHSTGGEFSGAQKWNVRGQKIEEKVQESVQLKATANAS